MFRIFLVVTLALTLSIFCACESGQDEPDGDAATPGDGDEPHGDPLADGDPLDVSDGDEDPGQSDGDLQPTDGDVPVSDGDMDDEGAGEDAEKEEESQTLVLPACVPGAIPERPFVNEDDPTFHMGPYLMHVTTESITVMWFTLASLDGTVFYGTGNVPDMQVSNAEGNIIHEFELTGLSPNTRYSYKVKSGDQESAIHHFYTAVDPGQQFIFSVMGDSRSDPNKAWEVVNEISLAKPYFNINVGDVVPSGEWEEWKQYFFDPFRGMSHKIPTYIATGNHENNSQNFYDLCAYPHPEDNEQHESFYSFTYGNAFFLIFDTNKRFFPVAGIESEISVWMEEQVASPEAQAATWRFAFAHEPGYSMGYNEDYDGQTAVRNWALPMFAEHDFHAYFAGHTHCYERGFKDGLLQIISGGGGAGLRTEKVHEFDHITEWVSTYHYVRVDVGCDKLRFEAVDLSGNVFDWVELDAAKPKEIADEMEDPTDGDLEE